ncbi:hypothetical protein P691DRAFT_761189 [Macrolepiota fuliginosa MF-IS2]|uniref:Uncharacterized protein n=1 Tax=Macrolepiota fuliginosa MF-IS2 TaxID=1400762 RepID=A0A9P5XAY2_9AGAR|nr:hypothetical protein P691DRAFT_761189 [Macrolepiota fuliginosa MF-IS2]
MTDQESKLPLPRFLKIFTTNGVSVPKAMAVAGKIYKEYSTPSRLAELTDVKLGAAGVSDKEDRKNVLAAIRKAGYVYRRKPLTKEEAIQTSVAQPAAGPSSSSILSNAASPFKRKRKHSSDKNEFFPDGSPDETADPENLNFNEVLDENVIRPKSCVINRAPIMTAWGMVVAERLGFRREEALSIASVYTEANAISKGIHLGVFNEGKGKDIEASQTGSQPYVNLMGRSIMNFVYETHFSYRSSPLYQTHEGQWRALSNGAPIFPSAAFSYISRSFKQTAPYVIGALRLLALSYPPGVLNTKGWSLYAEFRPRVDGWGKRSEIKLESILSLRRKEDMTSPLGNHSEGGAASQVAVPIIEDKGSCDDDPPLARGQSDEPRAKKAKTMTLEEYEAALDNDTTFNDVDLDFSEPGKSKGQSSR